jgi:RNA polymerase sigma-70 factor (ECF subfamily)
VSGPTPAPPPDAGPLDAAAFDGLARDQGPALYRVALAVLRNPADAEDAVQEAYLRAWRGREGYRGDAPAAGWMRRIVHNVAVERVRRVREVPVEEVEERWRDDAYSVDAQAVVERAADRQALEDALVHVPAEPRAAVLLHDLEGLSIAEVAEAQGITPDAAKLRLRRGRMALVTALGRGDEITAALDGVPLRCWDARRHVSDYLDGGLAPDLRTALERHLAGCPTCPPLYASLVGVRAALGRLRDTDRVVPAGLASRLVALRADRREPPM